VKINKKYIDEALNDASFPVLAATLVHISGDISLLEDLPKPKTISDLEKRSPLIQYMYKHRPSGQKIDRADKIESGHDFNSQESLIPGLVFNTEATVG